MDVEALLTAGFVAAQSVQGTSCSRTPLTPGFHPRPLRRLQKQSQRFGFGKALRACSTQHKEEKKKKEQKRSRCALLCSHCGLYNTVKNVKAGAVLNVQRRALSARFAAERVSSFFFVFCERCRGYGAVSLHKSRRLEGE